MQIHWMEYENQTSGQRIERIGFGSLTLLVGRSAAGKSEILKVLSDFLTIVLRDPPIFAKCHFRMEFSIGGTSYRWELATGGKTVQEEAEFEARLIVEERLEQKQSSGWKNIFHRKGDALEFQGYEKLPTVDPRKSILSIYRGTSPLKEIVKSFRQVSSVRRQELALMPVTEQQYHSVQKLLEDARTRKIELHMSALDMSEWSMVLDILVAKTAMPKMYQEFLEDLQDIFPEIEDVSIGQEMFETPKYVLTIRQDGTNIAQSNISSGMLRTIFLLATLHFRARESLVLFDELENSLGINCLDEIVDRILVQAAEGNMQFLLTSHHPYIINQIPVKDWLVIDQVHGVISAKRASEIGIGSGYREQFFELANYMRRRMS